VYYRENLLGKAFASDNCFRIPVDSYWRKRIGEHAIELYFHLKATLCEFEDALKYYWKHNTTKKQNEFEVALYILLEWLEWHEQPDLWVLEYEKAVKRGAAPRDSLEYTYKKLKKGLSFDEIWDSVHED
jgi:hypothetical protein